MALRYQLFYQMSRITRDKGSLAHDDRLDVLAMSCQYWADKIAKDADRSIQDRKDDLMRQELDKFLDVSTENTWINI